jgi:hypothetical protein
MISGKNRPFSGIALVSLGVLLLFSGCTRVVVVPPAPQLFSPSPIQVTAEQLCKEYIADSALADARYKDKEIWLTYAVINSSMVTEKDSYLAVKLSKVYTAEWSVDFIIRYIWVYYTDVIVYTQQPSFKTGDVIEIIGLCRGFQNNMVLVDINWSNKIGVGATAVPALGY